VQSYAMRKEWGWGVRVSLGNISEMKDKNVYLVCELFPGRCTKKTKRCFKELFRCCQWA